MPPSALRDATIPISRERALKSIEALSAAELEEVVVRDLGGTTNVNALVSHSRGRHVVRVYRSWTGRRRIDALRALRRRLRAGGLTVAAPLALHGGVFRTSEGWAETEEYIEHAPLPGDALATAAEALGRLHGALERCWDDSTPEPALPNYGTPPQLLEWAEATAWRARDLASTPELVARIAVAAGRLARLEARAGARLPWTPVHGDYTTANVGLTRGGEIAYFDFDVASFKPRVHELAYAALPLVRCSPLGGPAPLSLDTRMIDAYERTAPSPLGPEERAAMPLEMARICLCFASRVGFVPLAAGEPPPARDALIDAERLLDLAAA